jgi:hypothetical protein
MTKVIEYSLHYHRGTPSASEVVHKDKLWAENDLEADKIRRVLEANCPVDYDFNLLSQTSYLEKQRLA